MKRKIYEWPSRILSKKARAVSKDELAAMKQLEIDLIDTCNIGMGVGLAANQIGVLKRIVVIKPMEFGFKDFEGSDYNPEYLTLVNPKLSFSKTKKKWVEACLSVPMVSGRVERYDSCKVVYTDTSGEEKEINAKWPFAGGLQHECDHLDGTLYLSMMSRSSRHCIIEKLRKKRKKANVTRKKNGV